MQEAEASCLMGKTPRLVCHRDPRTSTIRLPRRSTSIDIVARTDTRRRRYTSFSAKNEKRRDSRRNGNRSPNQENDDLRLLVFPINEVRRDVFKGTMILRRNRKVREQATCHQFTVLSGERSVEPFSTGPNRSAADRFRLLRLFFFLFFFFFHRHYWRCCFFPGIRGANIPAL